MGKLDGKVAVITGGSAGLAVAGFVVASLRVLRGQIRHFLHAMMLCAWPEAGIPHSRPQAARRWTSQTAALMSNADSASSQPLSIHWNGQNRLAGW
jgi:hypothetical protein